MDVKHRLASDKLAHLVNERPRFNLAESYGTVLTWERIKELAGHAFSGLRFDYGTVAGNSGLRRLVGDMLGAEVNDLVITPGASAALFLTIFVTAGPGDDVVVVTPNFTPINEAVTASGARLVTVRGRFEDNYRLDIRALEAVCTGRTAMVILASPGMPSGRVVEPDQLAEIARVVRGASPRARIVIDEVYAWALHQGRDSLSAFQADGVDTVGSLSKSFGVPGIRVGWFASRDDELLRRLRSAKFNALITTSVIDEAIAEVILKAKAELLDEFGTALSERLGIVRAWIASQRGLIDWVEPERTAFAAIGLAAKGRAEQFYHALHQRGILVAPLDLFGGERAEFRIGFGLEPAERLREALDEISAVLRETLGGGASV